MNHAANRKGGAKLPKPGSAGISHGSSSNSSLAVGWQCASRTPERPCFSLWSHKLFWLKFFCFCYLFSGHLSSMEDAVTSLSAKASQSLKLNCSKRANLSLATYFPDSSFYIRVSSPLSGGLERWTWEAMHEEPLHRVRRQCRDLDHCWTQRLHRTGGGTPDIIPRGVYV